MKTVIEIKGYDKQYSVHVDGERITTNRFETKKEAQKWAELYVKTRSAEETDKRQA